MNTFKRLLITLAACSSFLIGGVAAADTAEQTLAACINLNPVMAETCANTYIATRSTVTPTPSPTEPVNSSAVATLAACVSNATTESAIIACRSAYMSAIGIPPVPPGSPDSSQSSGDPTIDALLTCVRNALAAGADSSVIAACRSSFLTTASATTTSWQASSTPQTSDDAATNAFRACILNAVSSASNIVTCWDAFRSVTGLGSTPGYTAPADVQTLVQTLRARVAELQSKIAQILSGQGGQATMPDTNALFGDAGGMRMVMKFVRTLRMGDHGDDVSSLQRCLALDSSIFPEGLVTGNFGPLTLKALQRWQSAHGIVSSGDPVTTGYGLFGPRTRAALQQACAQ